MLGPALSLIYAVVHLKFLTFLVSDRNTSFGFLVEVMDCFYKEGRATESLKYLPKEEPVYSVKSFAKVYEHNLKIPMLFCCSLLDWY